jgi:hypothetical protein
MGLIVKSPITLENGVTLTNAYLTFFSQKIENKQSFVVEYLGFANKKAYYNGLQPVFKSKVTVPYLKIYRNIPFAKLIYELIKSGYEKTEDIMEDDVSIFIAESIKVIEKIHTPDLDGHSKSINLFVTIKSDFDLELKSIQSFSGVDFK